MTDRELLELAAKAAGIEVTAIIKEGIPHRFGGGYWNPLNDDGDALRLAVKLRLLVNIDDGQSEAADGTKENVVIEPHGNDQFLATRRAIVRAAAEIGRVME